MPRLQMGGVAIGRAATTQVFINEAVAKLEIPSIEELLAEVPIEFKSGLVGEMQRLREMYPHNNWETGRNFYRTLGIKQAIVDNVNSANTLFTATRKPRNDLGMGKTLAFTKSWLTKNINKTIVEFDDFVLIGRVCNVTYNARLQGIPEYTSALTRLNNDWGKIPETWYKKLRSEKCAAYIALAQTMSLHMLHVSTDDPQKVAYFPTYRTMLQDRPQRTTMGKYLTKYKELLGLDELEIKTLAEHFAAIQAGASGWKLHFAGSNDPDTWYEVYKKGPHSCMVGNDAVRVYAHDKSELRLAYVENSAGDIIARCIIRETSQAKGYLRVYPDPDGTKEGTWLLDQLTAAGYGTEINLNGCLLALDEVRGGYVCPYIDVGDDGDQTCDTAHRDGKDYLILGEGLYACDTTQGYVDTDVSTCDICDDRMDEDEQNYIENEDICVCNDCLNARFTWARGRGEEWYYVRDSQITYCESDGNCYADDYLSENDVYECEVSGKYYKFDDLGSTSRGYVRLDSCTRLDHEDDDGNMYAADDDVTVLSDDTTCLDAEVETLSDGRTCHKSEYDDLQAEIDAEDDEDDEETETDAEIASEIVSEAEVLSAVIVTEPQTETNNEFAVAA